MIPLLVKMISLDEYLRLKNDGDLSLSSVYVITKDGEIVGEEWRGMPFPGNNIPEQYEVIVTTVIGDEENIKEESYGKHLEGETIQLTTKEVEGYDFAGWMKISEPDGMFSTDLTCDYTVSKEDLSDKSGQENTIQILALFEEHHEPIIR